MLKNHYRKVMALLLALMLAIGGIGFQPTQAAAASSTKVGTAYYTVTSSKNLTVEYAKPVKKTYTSATIPATVKINGKSYKVTSIAANAFSGCTKLKKVTIGKNVTKIGKKAFYGCKALTTVTIKTTKLTSSKVGASAFKSINAKAVVKVPSAKLASYKKILVAKGLTGKNQTVKAATTTTSATTSDAEKINVCDPTKSYFEDHYMLGEVVGNEEACWFRIMYDDANKESNKYSAGDIVSLRSAIELEPPIYGWWEKDTRKITGRYAQCRRCGKYFASYLTLAMHEVLELSNEGGCWGSTILGSADATFQPETWIFVPDPDPCKMVFQYELPQGVSYKEGSLKIKNLGYNVDYEGHYTTSVSGNILTLTIDDVKVMPFYKPFDYEACLKDITHDDNPENDGDMQEGSRYTIAVDLEVEVNESASIDNEIASTVTYSYKGYDHSISFGVMLHTAGLQISNTDSEGNSLSGATFDLYQMKTTYPSGSNLGTSNWSLLKSGIRAGEIVNGLGIGADKLGNEYRIVQTSVADGYKTALPLDFELSISMNNGQVVVSAEDDDGNDLAVKDGVVQVKVVNKSSGTTQTSQQSTVNTNTTLPATNTQTTTTPATSTTTTSTKKLVKVKATYYVDGVRDSSMTYQQTVDSAETMMDSKNIYDRSYVFTTYTLQKITLNGIEVSSLPAKVEDGSEVCYYYVS